MAEHVILFAGPLGAGKSTAIESLAGAVALSSKKVHLQEVPAETLSCESLNLDSGRKQGVILLIPQDALDPLAIMSRYLDTCAEMHLGGALLVGITRGDLGGRTDLSQFAENLAPRFPGILVPVFTVDPRDHEHMAAALFLLLARIETLHSQSSVEYADL